MSEQPLTEKLTCASKAFATMGYDLSCCDQAVIELRRLSAENERLRQESDYYEGLEEGIKVGRKEMSAEVTRQKGINATHLEEHQRLFTENERLTKIILTETDKFMDPPCCICGYDGRGYYQPEEHPCAAIWHERVSTEPAPVSPKTAIEKDNQKRDGDRQ